MTFSTSIFLGNTEINEIVTLHRDSCFVKHLIFLAVFPTMHNHTQHRRKKTLDRLKKIHACGPLLWFKLCRNLVKQRFYTRQEPDTMDKIFYMPKWLIHLKQTKYWATVSLYLNVTFKIWCYYLRTTSFAITTGVLQLNNKEMPLKKQ